MGRFDVITRRSDVYVYVSDLGIFLLHSKT